MQDMAGKVFLIADASNSIGRAVSRRLAEQGAKLVQCIPKSAQKHDYYGNMAENTVCCLKSPDFSKIQELETLVSEILANPSFGRLDGMFFNILPEVVRQRVGDVSLECVDRLIDRDITGAFLAAKVIGECISKNGGTMVFLGSIEDDKPTAIAPIYSMYMGALKNMVREAALFFGQYGVHSNLIELGAYEGVDALFRNDISKFYEGYQYKIPDGHVGTAEEAAELAVFLLSDRCRSVNGAEIRADGGLLLHYLDPIANTRAYKRMGNGLCAKNSQEKHS